ncbi:hypothetical protein QFC22_004388 [Naganishia vaughanmartiniae]|uniref:Uncharacterized protein n=1 Tax=Naganishia vaughanmartiniae TaxID=1424756 RepID=A0ACC2X198_9TREE|nr:hypothetical protein QFC22_004388 [Naganishia vaughanmartiniae]
MEVNFLQLFPDGEHCAQQLLPASPPLSVISESPVTSVVQSMPVSSYQGKFEERLNIMKEKKKKARMRAMERRETTKLTADNLHSTANQQERTTTSLGPTNPPAGSSLTQPNVPVTPVEPVSATPDTSVDQNHQNQPPVPPEATGSVRQAEQSRQQESQPRAERETLLQRSIEARMMSERAEQESQYRAAWTRNAIDIFAADAGADREFEERQRHAQQAAKEKADQEQHRQTIQREIKDARLARTQDENAEIQRTLQSRAQEHRSALESADKARQALVRQRELKESEERAEKEKKQIEEQRRRDSEAAEMRAAREKAAQLQIAEDEWRRAQEQRVAREMAERTERDRIDQERQEKRAQEVRSTQDGAARAAELSRREQQQRQQQQQAADAAAEEPRMAQLKRSQAAKDWSDEQTRRRQSAGTSFNAGASNATAQVSGQPSVPQNGSGHSGPSNVGSSGGPPGPSPAIIAELRNAMLQIEVQISSTQTKLQQLQASSNDGNSVILKHVQQNVLIEQLRTLMNIHTKISSELREQQLQARAAVNVPLGHAAFVQRDPSYSQQSSYGQPQPYMAQTQHVVPNRSQNQASGYIRPQHTGTASVPPLTQPPLHHLHPVQIHSQDHATSSNSPVSHQSFNHVPNPISGQVPTQPYGPVEAQASLGPAHPQERRASYPQAQMQGQVMWQSSAPTQATINAVGSVQSPAQSTSPALSQGRNSTGSVSTGHAPVPPRGSEERAEYRRREEDVLARLRELEDRERKREEEYSQNKAAELEREAKRLSELRESQQTILRQQELIFQQSQLIANQQLSNHNVQNATSSELVTQGQLYMQNLSQAMQTHERLLRAQQFNMGIVQSPQVYGEPTPVFVDSAPPLADPQPFDILDIGPLPGENVQQDTAERFTEIHDHPAAPDSARSGRGGLHQTSLSRPGKAESRAPENPVTNSTAPLRNASDTASQIPAIRDTQRTPIPTASMAVNPPMAESIEHNAPQSNKPTSQPSYSHGPRPAQDTMFAPVVAGFGNHPDASNTTPGQRSHPNLNIVNADSWSHTQRFLVEQPQQTASSLSIAYAAPPSAQLLTPVPATAQYTTSQRNTQEDQKSIILPYHHPRARVAEDQIQTPFTSAPVLQNAQAAAQAMVPGPSVMTQSVASAAVALAPQSEGPLEIETSRVRERSDSDSEQSADERPIKRRRTDQSRFIPPKFASRRSPVVKIEPGTRLDTTITTAIPVTTPSDLNTSSDSGTSGVVVEISMSEVDTPDIRTGQTYKSDDGMTPSTAGMGTITFGPATVTSAPPKLAGVLTPQSSQTATPPAQGTPKRASSVRQTLEVVFAKNPSPSDAAFRKLAETLRIEDIEPVKQLFALWRRNQHKTTLIPTTAMTGGGSGGGP